jgi:hypothetical protein
MEDKCSASMTVIESRRSVNEREANQRTRCLTASAAFALAVVLFSATAAAAGDGPQTLPAPEVPLRAVPQTTTTQRAPYLGPPPGIDGPEVIPPTTGGIPEEMIVPGMEGIMLPGELVDEDLAADGLFAPPQKISAYKDGFFQKLSLSAGWLGNNGDPADLAITEIETFVQVGLPAPIIQWPLLITPGFNWTLIDGPMVTDLPPRLYVAYVDLMWLPQIVRGYTLLISVVPTVYGDFDAHEFRLTGKGLLIYDCIPNRLQFVGGVLYLNRENIRLLPAGGFIWTPEDWTRLELIFPKPRLAWRYNAGIGYEDWIYTTAEFGGNTWPIIRARGERDDVTYVDYRLLVGIERKLDGGAGYRLEAGYVLGRNISFASGRGDFDPQDTVLLRGGITY